MHIFEFWKNFIFLRYVYKKKISLPFLCLLLLSQLLKKKKKSRIPKRKYSPKHIYDNLLKDRSIIVLYF